MKPILQAQSLGVNVLRKSWDLSWSALVWTTAWVVQVTSSFAAIPELALLDSGFRVEDLTAEDRMDWIRRQGFAGVVVELSEPQWIRQTGELADRMHVRLHGVRTSARLTRDALAVDPRLEGVVAALRGFPAAIWLVIHSGEFTRSSEVGDEIAVPELRKWADRAAAAGTRVALLPAPGAWVERLDDALRLLRKAQHPQLGLVVNLGHWLRMGGRDPDSLFVEAGPWLWAMVIHGVTRSESNPASVRVVGLHEGDYDWAAVVQAGMRHGFTGVWCLQLPPVGDPVEILRASVQAWRNKFP